MKKTILLLVLTLAIASFQNKLNAQTKYAFVTDTEHDKSLDEEGKNGYVSITTDIASVNCSIGKSSIEIQYIQHYKAEEKTQNRERAFIGSPGITTAWIYNSYDEALASRRDWLAKQSREHKRTIKYFYITCN